MGYHELWTEVVAMVKGLLPTSGQQLRARDWVAGFPASSYGGSGCAIRGEVEAHHIIIISYKREFTGGGRAGVLSGREVWTTAQ